LRTGGLACDRLPPVVLPDVLLVRGDARREPVGSADLLKLRRDLAVIQIRVISAVAADELVRVGAAAFRVARHDAERPPPQYHRPAEPGLGMIGHACPLPLAGPCAEGHATAGITSPVAGPNGQ